MLNELYHHGVKGQRWGVRKQPEEYNSPASTSRAVARQIKRAAKAEIRSAKIKAKTNIKAKRMQIKADRKNLKIQKKIAKLEKDAAKIKAEQAKKEAAFNKGKKFGEFLIKSGAMSFFAASLGAAFGKATANLMNEKSSIKKSKRDIYRQLGNIKFEREQIDKEYKRLNKARADLERRQIEAGEQVVYRILDKENS